MAASAFGYVDLGRFGETATIAVTGSSAKFSSMPAAGSYILQCAVAIHIRIDSDDADGVDAGQGDFFLQAGNYARIYLGLGDHLHAVKHTGETDSTLYVTQVL